MRPAGHFRLILGAVGIAWILAVGLGFSLVESYRAAPGGGGDPPPRWPADSRLAPDAARANLVVLAHPRCPCTRASLAELERIMTRCRGLVTAHVLFFRPEGSPETWGRTDLWRTAAAIPDVRAVADEGGTEAARFGAETSGHALLYDRGGRLVFSGGITGSRGHQGDNAGRGAVIALLTRARSDRGQAAVFGCPLFEARPRPDERAATCRSRP